MSSTMPAAENHQHWAPQIALKYEMQVNSQLDFQPFKKPRICESKEQTLCLQFKRGKCSYGGNCIYSHSVVNKLPLDRPKRTMPEGGQWDERQRMVSSKVKLCWWSFSGEDCPFGDKCQFVHKDEYKFKGSLERSSDCVVLSGETKREHRKVGHDSHENYQVDDLKGVLWKTRLCYKWMKSGSCMYGANCHFAHGQAELKKLGSLTALGSGTNPSLVNALATLPKDAASSKTVIRSAYEQEKQGKKSLLKWNEVEKISRVYADWIDHTPPIEVVSGKVES